MTEKTEVERAEEAVQAMRQLGARFSIIRSAGPEPQWLWEPAKGRRAETVAYWKGLDHKPSRTAMVAAILRAQFGGAP